MTRRFDEESGKILVLSRRFLDDLKQRKGIRFNTGPFPVASEARVCGSTQLTSPSRVSTVRTRMLLFTCASGIMVSRLVSERTKRFRLQEDSKRANKPGSLGR